MSHLNIWAQNFLEKEQIHKIDHDIQNLNHAIHWLETGWHRINIGKIKQRKNGNTELNRILKHAYSQNTKTHESLNKLTKKTPKAKQKTRNEKGPETV